MIAFVLHGNFAKVQQSYTFWGQAMEALFQVRPIDSDSLRSAYAVMQLAMPGLTLPDFRKIVGSGRSAGRNAAVYGIFDRRNYIHVIFRSQIEAPFGEGQRLRIYDLLLSDLISTALLSQMIDALEIFARSCRCDQMTIEAARTETHTGLPLSDVLVMRGFSGESLLMARRI